MRPVSSASSGAAIPAQPHGGDWASYQREHGVLPLDFSASVSPLGLPDSVRAAVADALDHADRYPDPACRELRTALARAHGVTPEQVICGNGAADLIYRAAYGLRPQRALVCDPTFSEYAQALEQAGCAVEHLPLKTAEGFSLDVDALLGELGSGGFDLLVLCEPNNPTGRVTPRQDLLRVLRGCAAAGTGLLVDECFNDFLDDPAAHTLTPFLGEFPNLLVLKAFTKLYAMAGLRLGYGLCSDPQLLARLEAAGSPWSVSTPAQAAGLAALGDKTYRNRVRSLVRAERPRLAAALAARGFEVVPGEANYLLFYAADPALGQELAARGVLVRDCSGFRGLAPGWYRVAVRTSEDNGRLLAALDAAGYPPRVPIADPQPHAHPAEEGFSHG